MDVLSQRLCSDTWKLEKPVCNPIGVTRPVTTGVKVLAPSSEEKRNNTINIRSRET